MSLLTSPPGGVTCEGIASKLSILCLQYQKETASTFLKFWCDTSYRSPFRCIFGYNWSFEILLLMEFWVDRQMDGFLIPINVINGSQLTAEEECSGGVWCGSNILDHYSVQWWIEFLILRSLILSQILHYCFTNKPFLQLYSCINKFI